MMYKQEFLDKMRRSIENFDKNPSAGNPFPPVRASSFDTIPGSVSMKGFATGSWMASPTLGKLAQHQMSNVIDPMEQLVRRNRLKLQNFMNACP